jgi:hypothetical protein
VLAVDAVLYIFVVVTLATRLFFSFLSFPLGGGSYLADDTTAATFRVSLKTVSPGHFCLIIRLDDERPGERQSPSKIQFVWVYSYSPHTTFRIYIDRNIKEMAGPARK